MKKSQKKPATKKDSLVGEKFTDMQKQCRIKDKLFSGNPRQIISILLVIVLGILALFFWEGHLGFNISDEGFLWYGAQRVMLGEVPMRDFQSYDIGRYYWSAAFMRLLGDNGIVTLRMAAMFFYTIAVCIGLSVLVRSSTKQNRIFWLLATFTLVVWMSPVYKLFDASMPIILIASLTFLVEQPSSRRYLLSGLIVGLAAVFGRNHGVYGVVGSLSVMLYLNAKGECGPSLIKAFSFWSLGVVVGYLPVLVFLAFVPGFALAFWESTRVLLFEIKATNIPLPVPWPWLVPFGNLPPNLMLQGVLMGVFFIAIIIFGVLGIVWVIRQRLLNKLVSPTLIASVFLALPYTYYTYSRADLEHLELGIAPFLLGIFALLESQSSKIKWPFAALLCGASLFTTFLLHPGWYCYSQQCVDIKVAGDTLNVNLCEARTLTIRDKLVEVFASGDQNFMVIPFTPGVYAALGRKSPMWEIYPLYPSNAASQQAEIERIKAANPSLAIIDNAPLDGRDDLRFRNTHPIINQYISDNFELITFFRQNLAIYRSKHAVQ